MMGGITTAEKATMTMGVPSTQQVATVMGKPVTFGQTIQSAGASALPSAIATGFPAVTTPQILGGGTTPGVVGTGIGVRGGAGAGGGAGTQAPTTLGAKLGQVLTKPETILGGAGVLGSMAIKQPAYPELPVDVEGIRTSLLSGEGLSPLARRARTSLTEIMNKKPEELYPVAKDAYYDAALRQTRLAYQRAQEALAKRYNLVDPNYAQSGEYQELARRLDTELANIETDYAQTEEQRRFELARQTQYQAIRDALNISDRDMQTLLGLTGLSIEQAAAEYNVKAQDVDELRRALGGLGGQLLVSGITSQPRT
jgi:hypothetical protein